jgi:hypothetical protein
VPKYSTDFQAAKNMHLRPQQAPPTPRTLQDAVTHIQGVFPEASLADWAAHPQDSACARAIWDLGMWIRNQWIHTNAPIAQAITQQWPGIDPDEASRLVLRALWQTLNGHPCPSIADLRPEAYFHFEPLKLQWD